MKACIPVILLFLVLSFAQANTEWPMQAGNLEATLYSDAEVEPTAPDFGLLWRVRIPGTAMAPPIVADGKVFINLLNSSSVYAFDTLDGALCWVAVDSNSFGHQDQVFNSAISYYRNHVYYRANFQGTGNNGIRLVKARSSDGRRVWSVKLHNSWHNSPKQFYCDIGCNGLIYGITVNNFGAASTDSLHCFARDTGDGHIVWKYTTEAVRGTDRYVSYTRVTIDTNSTPRRLFLSLPPNYYYCLNLETGQELWKRTHVEGYAGRSFSYHNNKLYVGFGASSGMMVIDASNGDRLAYDDFVNLAQYKNALGIGIHPDSNYIAARITYISAVFDKNLARKGSSLGAVLGNPVTTSSACSQPLWLKGKSTVHDLGYLIYGNTKTSWANNVRGGSRVLCMSVRKMATNENSLKLPWQFQATSPGCAAPSAAGGRLYYLGSNGVLHCFGHNR